MDFSPDLIVLLTFILKGFGVVQQVLNKGKGARRCAPTITTIMPHFLQVF
jgi:hypothetical protein